MKGETVDTMVAVIAELLREFPRAHFPHPHLVRGRTHEPITIRAERERRLPGAVEEKVRLARKAMDQRAGSRQEDDDFLIAIGGNIDTIGTVGDIVDSALG